MYACMHACMHVCMCVDLFHPSTIYPSIHLSIDPRLYLDLYFYLYLNPYLYLCLNMRIHRAPTGDRTQDHTLTKRMLCQLSYRGDVRMSKRKLCKLSISPCNTSRRNAESTSPPQRISCLLLSRRVSIFVASHHIAEGCLPCMGMLLVIRYDGRTGIYANGQHRRSK